MRDISKIDKNFAVQTNIGKDDVVFYDPQQAPFEINGVYYDNGQFRRLPESVAKATNEGVWSLHANTAGGRIRFRTDSPYVAIVVKMPEVLKRSHFSLTGSIGFDVYAHDGDTWFCKSFVPPFDIVDGYESVIDMTTGGMKEIVVHMPLYSEVSEVYIGLCDSAKVEPPTPYAVQTPVVFYGSSITQGGCASRPGNAYENMISRRLNVDHVNLGFSGSARGEDVIADYIKGLDMSVFVYDYDENAPTPEHLQNTHERMFLKIREANPTLPIVMLTRPKHRLVEHEVRRLEIVKTTYENAKARGDENVYFIDGLTLLQWSGIDGLIDNCHPNDLGFYSMASALEPVLKTILKG